MYLLRFDGLYREMWNGRAGVMCYGWLITHNDVVIARGHGAFARGKDANSNVAEYLALIEGLEAMVDLNVGKETVHVVGDAKSVIEQMQGRAMVHAPHIRPLHRRASRLAQLIANLFWRWLPRSRNQEADLLSRRAIRQLGLNLATVPVHSSASHRLTSLGGVRVYRGR